MVEGEREDNEEVLEELRLGFALTPHTCIGGIRNFEDDNP